MAMSKDSTNLATSKANKRTIVILFFRTCITQQCFAGLNKKSCNNITRKF